mmetsp:Transcript_19617/g.14334  ORF Transcript_19617/g.14334 Transcript_19617/m.14334 type:complete len:86 (-) Transcript_19617:450-707(-)
MRLGVKAMEHFWEVEQESGTDLNKRLRERREEIMGVPPENEYGLLKSKSLGREYAQMKQEINHRKIPIDILLDAKPNILYHELQE